MDPVKVLAMREENRRLRAALVALLEPYSRFRDRDLLAAARENRVPAGLGKHQPREVLAARLAAGLTDLGKLHG